MKNVKKSFLIVLTSLFLVGCASKSEIHDEVFNVSFKDYDGNIIYIAQVKYGETATFVGDLPKIPADIEKCYPFTGWDKSLVNVTSNLEVNPTHGEEYNISDYSFVSDCRVFQNATVFNDDTTNYDGYLQQFGFPTYLKESVEVDGSVVSTVILDYDDETVVFDYSNVNTAEKGDYTFTISVRGLVKESPIKVVTDTTKWGDSHDIPGGYETYDPNFVGKADNFKFYPDNKCVIESSTYDEFYPMSYEMADDNISVIIRSEDGSIDCKYFYGEKITPYAISGVKRYISGTFYDSLQCITMNDFIDDTSGYAYLVGRLEAGVFYLTTKYEYNRETKAMKLFGSFFFNSLTYNAESNELVYVE